MVHRHEPEPPQHAGRRNPDDSRPPEADVEPARAPDVAAGDPTASDKKEDASDNVAAPASPQPEEPQRRLRHSRDLGHIPHTRIRTSTAIVGVLFIVCVVLYGYTSQRYGIVEPPPAPTHHRTTVQTTPSATYSSPTSYPSSTEPSDSLAPPVGGSEEPGAPGEQGAQTGEPSGQPTTTSRNGPFDLFNRQTQQNETPAVPSR